MMAYILIGVVVAVLIALLIYGKRRKVWAQYFWRRIMLVWVGILLVLGVAVAPIRIKSNGNGVSNLDLIIVADLTQSMNAVDGRGGSERTRIEDMRDDIKQLANTYAGASIGVYTFADATQLYLPLTTGIDDVISAADTLYTASQFQAVPIVTSYKDVFSTVSSYVKAQHDVDPTRQRVVVFMSDFEIYKEQEQPGDIVTAAKQLTEQGASLATVAYGQDTPANMLLMRYDYETGVYEPNYKKYGSEEYEKYLQQNGKTVQSTANPELAEQIASETGGSVAHATKDQASIASALKASIKYSAKLTAQSTQTQAIQQNPFYVIPALMLFVWLVLVEVIRLPAVASRLWHPRRKGGKP